MHNIYSGRDIGVINRIVTRTVVNRRKELLAEAFLEVRIWNKSLVPQTAVEIDVSREMEEFNSGQLGAGKRIYEVPSNCNCFL